MAEKGSKTYRYDEQGRVVAPEANLEAFEYDGDGKEIKKYRKNGTDTIDRP
jgi:YD repeat-containing protein